MSFLQSFSIEPNRTQPFPFNVPAVRFAQSLATDSGVVIFVGDNGSGKSTLLESLALALDLPLIGGRIGGHPGFEAARTLKPFVKLEWKRQVRQGFFFRAEDFSDFVNSIENEKKKIRGDLRELEGRVDDRIIQQLLESESMNHTLRQIRKDYGDDMQQYSHGEAYLKIIQTRIRGKGLYLLDEPEAALSPLKQLSLMAFVLDVLKEGNSQFLMATHSPILMGLPGARLYEITGDEMKEVAYQDTEHYRITKTFLDRPETYLRHF